MEFEITRDELLKPLQQVAGVVDKKQLQPILSFVLLTFNDNELIVSATDLDIQLCAKISIAPQAEMGKLVLPCRKLLDICKLLPDNSNIKLKYIKSDTDNNSKVIITSNRSRFTLSTLDPDDFPLKTEQLNGFSIAIPQNKLRSLLNATSFAIPQQDVRHYLMGMLWEFNQHEFRVVASDGHRLAMASYSDSKIFPNCQIKVIMPRKSISELFRLLEAGDSDIFINISDKSAQITTNELTFTTKLVDAHFPSYMNVFSSVTEPYTIEIEKENLKNILNRVAILSNEKHRAVRFCFSDNQVVIAANNPEHEQAEELLEIIYNYSPLEVCFNVTYLLDVLNKIPTNKIILQLKQATTPVLITPFAINELPNVNNSEEAIKDLASCSYIIMPMFL